MLLYSIIMFLTAAVMAAMSIAVYRGNTHLIHDYHQAKVTDPAAYGKAFGKAWSVIPAAMVLSGITSLLGTSDKIVAIAVAILLIGLGIGIGCIVAVQKKYNKGIF